MLLVFCGGQTTNKKKGKHDRCRFFWLSQISGVHTWLVQQIQMSLNCSRRRLNNQRHVLHFPYFWLFDQRFSITLPQRLTRDRMVKIDASEAEISGLLISCKGRTVWLTPLSNESLRQARITLMTTLGLFSQTSRQSSSQATEDIRQLFWQAE